MKWADMRFQCSRLEEQDMTNQIVAEFQGVEHSMKSGGQALVTYRVLDQSFHPPMRAYIIDADAAIATITAAQGEGVPVAWMIRRNKPSLADATAYLTFHDMDAEAARERGDTATPLFASSTPPQEPAPPAPVTDWWRDAVDAAARLHVIDDDEYEWIDWKARELKIAALSPAAQRVDGWIDVVDTEYGQGVQFSKGFIDYAPVGRYALLAIPAANAAQDVQS